MKISVKVFYAAIAVVELSLATDEKPVPLRVIAEKYKIPLNFYLQILLKLKQAKIVKSIRGKEGGFRLLGIPSDWSLWEIESLFENRTDFRVASEKTIKNVSSLDISTLPEKKYEVDSSILPDSSDLSLWDTPVSSGDSSFPPDLFFEEMVFAETEGEIVRNVLRQTWQEAEETRRNYLKSVSFGDLLEKIRRQLARQFSV